MAESTRPTAEGLRGVIEDALAAGMFTKDEILNIVSTANPPTITTGHAPDELNTGENDLPIYTELPDGLINLPSAAAHYGCTVQRFRRWVKMGYIKTHGRLRAGCPGGGYLVVVKEDLERRMAITQTKGGRPRKIPLL